MTAIFLPMGDCAEYIARLTKCLTMALQLVNINSTNLQNRFSINIRVVLNANRLCAAPHFVLVVYNTSTIATSATVAN